MKNIFLISIIWITVCLSVNGQSSENVFPTSDAIWNITMYMKEYYFGLKGDTIINDTIYNKLYLLNDTTLIIDQEDVYFGGFRQEGKKVWYRPYKISPLALYYNVDEQHGETLLYDFSKNVGDTIWHNYLFTGENYVFRDSIHKSIITAIDTDEQNKIIFHTSQYDIGRYDIWAERIGSIEYGLFLLLYARALSEDPAYHLNCFKQDDEVLYLDNPNCNKCFCFKDPGSIEKNVISIDVFYENGNVIIKKDLSQFPYEIKIFNAIGYLVFEKKLQSDYEEIPFNNKGIWLYEINKNKEIIKTGKLITY